jgi:hypothetical protein
MTPLAQERDDAVVREPGGAVAPEARHLVVHDQHVEATP